jgi:hypothetical protein
MYLKGKGPRAPSDLHLYKTPYAFLKISEVLHKTVCLKYISYQFLKKTTGQLLLTTKVLALVYAAAALVSVFRCCIFLGSSHPILIENICQWCHFVA